MENQYGFIEKTVTLKIINGTKVRKKQRFQFNACTVITRKMDGKGCVCIKKQMATVSFAQSGLWDGASYTSADIKRQRQASSL